MDKRFKQTLHHREYMDAKTYMRRCSTSLTIRERHAETMMRFHHVPIRMARIKIADKNKQKITENKC